MGATLRGNYAIVEHVDEDQVPVRGIGGGDVNPGRPEGSGGPDRVPCRYGVRLRTLRMSGDARATAPQATRFPESQ
jgi:hypothetical protein